MNTQSSPLKYAYLPLGPLDDLGWGDDAAREALKVFFKKNGIDVYIVDYSREDAEQDYTYCRTILEEIAAPFGIRIVPSTMVDEVQHYKDQLLREVNNKNGNVVLYRPFADLQEILQANG